METEMTFDELTVKFKSIVPFAIVIDGEMPEVHNAPFLMVIDSEGNKYSAIKTGIDFGEYTVKALKGE